MKLIDAAAVRDWLTYERAIPIVREAMVRFSRGETGQLLRSILPIRDEMVFGVMPGSLGPGRVFGAKLVSAQSGQRARGGRSHQGLVVLFDGETGAPVGLVDADALTAIRTAAASAVATDVLARREASVLAVFGGGEQARAHVRAISSVRNLTEVRIWTRRVEQAEELARSLGEALAVPIRAVPTAQAAAEEADILCTVSAAATPVLQGRWVMPGAHVNLVGSSYPGPVEVDSDLVVRARFIADSREGVLAQGAEFLVAKAEGRVGDDHVVGEIGEVLDGRVVGRTSTQEVTAYKSLGHIVQDLATAEALVRALG